MADPDIAWIDAPAPTGRWGRPGELGLPLADRGLLLADGIFETVLVLDGRPRLLAEHLRRWTEGAALLGMEPPPPLAQVEALIAEAIRRSAISTGALRLNWSRGTPAAAGARGIAIRAGCRHRFWLQLSATSPCFAPVRVIVSPTETRSATSLLSRAKTFSYGSAVQARRQAAAAGADDALLRSSAGGLCCATSANLLVHTGGGWCTPPLSSGCLPGVMRARALALGLVREAEIGEADLAASGGGLLLNSLGCRPISHLAGNPLTWVEDWLPAGESKEDGSPAGLGLSLAEAAEHLWRWLLEG
ncbi:aminotransferase class IV [Cyanobium sp. CH-040]|uniref:aminotransferase class IV n=1 Tax=Cyanobium sp. CH-040 TaxID=2823708 RepID=UPI0020CBB604|nr:aminotransferase class IV [Cyanobium sp. CH-040]MCP9928402.1 aminotransferase class IV [Cyanobium sp. CH-040]